MAIATAPVLDEIERRIFHERYLTAVTRGYPQSMPDGSISMAFDNSKDYYRWEAIVRRIACAMKGDHIGEAELEKVDAVMSEMWAELEHRLADVLAA